MLSHAEIFEFGSFTLDPDRCLLTADGTPVPLSSRALQILELLLVNRGRVVSRDEIIAHVWRGVSVAQNNLPVQMSALRAALAAQPGGERLIITLPGQGYRFVGQVRVVRSEQTQDEAPSTSVLVAPSAMPNAKRLVRRWGLPAALIFVITVLAGVVHPWRTAPAAPRFSIAVLPFRDLSSTNRQEYVADAITDDLTTDLAHIPGSVVIARESADVFKGRAVGASDVGRALNVRYLLEGSIRNEDTAFHINVQLIDAEAGTQLWAQIFETPHDKVAEAQASIVRRIGSALNIQLFEIEAARSERERPNDPDALDLLFRAKSILDRDGTLHGFSSAQKLLRDAVAKQPEFAEAWAELGWVVLRKIQDVDDPDDEKDFAEASAAVSKAVTLAPQGFLALAAQASLLEAEDRCEEAQYSARAAVAVNASSVQAWSVIADCMQAEGHLEDALQALVTLLRIDPENARNKSRYLAMGHIKLLEGDYNQALDFLRKATVGDPEPAPGADSLDRVEISRLLTIGAKDLSGDREGARRAYDEYQKVWPNRSVWRIGTYYTKAVSNLPGYTKLMRALLDAGMPQYMSGTKDCLAHDPIKSSDDTVEQSAAFAPSPGEAPGVTVATAGQVKSLLGEQTLPLILDVSNGVSAIDGAIWKPPTYEQKSDLTFAMESVASRAKGSVSTRIIVMSDGPCGLRSYSLATSLARQGVPNIVWFRGGEEAWTAAGYTGRDLRLQ